MKKVATDFGLEKAKTQQKSVVLAYLLWWFLGWLGIHRLYAGMSKWWLYPVLGLVGAITVFILVGYVILLGLFIWWIIDAVNLHKVIQLQNLEVIENYEKSTQNQMS
ncbi:TM2 domain-containing protein [Arcobacter arenosus]|uniref:TM2 domain-containing protein n=1 Tax=Arcobacter arenosus TaxID=2576037 RepID=A0A5R8XXJ0_9BACT|nr:TM2 domain-containing protein [Arcobacter arenosus]